MIHEGFVLELTLETSWVANTIPRFNANEGCLFIIRTPESTDRSLIIYRNGRFAIGIHQHGTMRLTVMNLYGVIAEKVVVDFQDTHISLQGHVHHIVATISITLQCIHGFLVVEFNHTL